MTPSPKIIRVLMVCTGNICRSPMAEAVFRQMVTQAGLADRIDVESAGIGNWHVGQRPHAGTLATLRAHQIEVGSKRAQQLIRAHFNDFDYIIAMDQQNLDDIQAIFRRSVPLLLHFAANSPMREVPDPYYDNTFEQVYALVTLGCAGLLQTIRAEQNI